MSVYSSLLRTQVLRGVADGQRGQRAVAGICKKHAGETGRVLSRGGWAFAALVFGSFPRAYSTTG